MTERDLREFRLTEPAPLPPVVKLDLVGVAEVAAILGCGKSALWDRRHHSRFPQPVAELACGPIWLRSEIEEYLGAG